MELETKFLVSILALLGGIFVLLTSMWWYARSLMKNSVLTQKSFPESNLPIRAQPEVQNRFYMSFKEQLTPSTSPEREIHIMGQHHGISTPRGKAVQVKIRIMRQSGCYRFLIKFFSGDCLTFDSLRSIMVNE